MTGNLASVVVAGIGVVGTLGAAVLTQTRADRLKRLELVQVASQRAEELRHADRLREAEVERERSQERLAARRLCYIGVNMTARQYLAALRNHVHALRRDSAVAATDEQLERCRKAHGESYAEAQMIVPLAVLESLRVANAKLGSTYGQLKRVELHQAEPGESLQSVQVAVQDAQGSLREVRRLMRLDLGVDPDPAGEAEAATVGSHGDG